VDVDILRGKRRDGLGLSCCESCSFEPVEYGIEVGLVDVDEIVLFEDVYCFLDCDSLAVLWANRDGDAIASFETEIIE